MKKLITIIVFYLSLSSCYSQMLTKTDSVNIKKLKDIVVFTGELKRSFDGLIEIWYYQSKQKRKSEKTAFIETLDKLAAQIDKFNKLTP